MIKRIEDGTLTYRDGAFVGERNITLSKTMRDLGGRFNKVRKVWELPFEKLPLDIQTAIIQAKRRAELIEASTMRMLSDVQRKALEVIPHTSFQGLSRETLLKMADKVRSTVPKEISVQPELDPSSTRQLNADYTNNVKLSIVGFIDDEVLRFRKELLPEIRAGVGRKAMADYINKRLKVGKDRAKFIARQETNLFTSKVKQKQYQEAGIEKYRWRAVGGKSGDGRTRENHMEAHGKVFYWDHSKNPNPVRNSKGEPVHPRQDFGCRCDAIPIIEEL